METEAAVVGLVVVQVMRMGLVVAVVEMVETKIFVEEMIDMVVEDMI